MGNGAEFTILDVIALQLKRRSHGFEFLISGSPNRFQSRQLPFPTFRIPHSAFPI